MHQPTAQRQTSTTALTTPANSPPQAPRKPKQLRVTGVVRTAIEAMVWQGLTRAQAAEHAGMTEHGLYVAFRKPHVKAHYLRELDVLRTSEKARNIHALLEVRDQRDNQMARVNAVKALNEADDVGERKAAATTPGITIVIAGDNAKTAVQVNHTQSPDTVCPADDDGTR